MKSENNLDFLYIIIPAYNEEENIEDVINEWYPILEQYGAESNSRLVIINDGSKDMTANKIKSLQPEHPLLVLLNKENEGHGSAVLFGYHYAMKEGATFVFQTDSDRQTTSLEFKQFWNNRYQYDAVIGSRPNREDGCLRIFVEDVLCIIIRLIFGVKIPDANAPYRLMKVSLLDKYIDKMPPKYFLPNVMLTTYFVYFKEKVLFLPITFKARRNGTNSINWKKIIKIGLNAVGDFMALRKKIDD